MFRSVRVPLSALNGQLLLLLLAHVLRQVPFGLSLVPNLVLSGHIVVLFPQALSDDGTGPCGA